MIMQTSSGSSTVSWASNNFGIDHTWLAISNAKFKLWIPFVYTFQLVTGF